MTTNRFSTASDRTRAHYEEHPFEFMTSVHEQDVKSLQPRPFLSFLDRYVLAESKVCEVGCGPGRATMYLDLLGLQVTAVDISQKSIDLAKHRSPRVNFVLANNLSLPFTDDSFDIVISDGVIRHTASPRLSFSENSRILEF
jgi:ubiquinone/menaquinone biosynthesis C-methylase UbiE